MQLSANRCDPWGKTSLVVNHRGAWWLALRRVSLQQCSLLEHVDDPLSLATGPPWVRSMGVHKWPTTIPGESLDCSVFGGTTNGIADSYFSGFET